ncbi:HNH endonuclease [Lysinibacillus sphaericus]|uniref:HNH endonuclease n=1 Tax=Lysinibacillus sphaericus TaxID=1421 RepID=UPI001CBC8B54|nr:HNH endonuclease [Lysinibacillus sphaericus]
MGEFSLVEDLKEIKQNMIQFNKDIKENEEMRRRFFSHFRQWYYIKELDMFAPSKYIGYKNMNALKYNNKDGTGADGRKTEAVLGKWFEKKDIPELLEELQEKMNGYGRVKINSEIHILKEEIEQIEYELALKNNKGIPAIRLLPMSEDDPEFGEKSIEDLQEWFNDELPYRVYNFKKGMVTPPGTLVLFQYKGCVIASAILEEKVLYGERTEGGYSGAYNFVPSSIAVFTPIKSNELKSVWDKFKGFNQSSQKLDVNQFNSFCRLLLNKNFRYVLEENQDEEYFQEEIERTEIDSSIVVEDLPRELIEGEYNHSLTTKWKRNHVTSKKAIVLADFKCEYDNSHMFFKSSTTGENYVEAHHLIPMEFQKQFEKSLDIEANIISLCALCHKKVHHSTMEEKKPILESLFLERRNRLEKCEISIELVDLITMYK